MKAIRTIISLVAITLLWGGVATAHQTKSWHYLTQSQRNWYIIDSAWQDLGKVGGQCKAWVQNVVYRASAYHVWLPPNNYSPYDYYWQYDYNGHAIGMSMPIEYVQPGYIIQMRLKSGTPHTAIVYNIGPYSITFIESNWFQDETVHVRTLDFSTFRSQVSAYTVYYVK